MGFLTKDSRDEAEYEVTDTLIIFDADNHTTEILNVTDVTENSVLVSGKNEVPLKDLVVSTGRYGRVFFYKAPTESITQTHNLAMLEYDKVLSQITAYNQPEAPGGMDLMKWIMAGIIALQLIVMAFVG